jgi:hypothetical protein
VTENPTALVREVAGVSLATQGHYIIKRKFWSFFERVFRVWTMDGQLIMYIKHPLLKLREEFTVYADEARTRPLLFMKSRQMIAINFTYDVVDAATGMLLGTVQKKGLASIIRDKFIISDANGVEVGYAEEQGAGSSRCSRRSTRSSSMASRPPTSSRSSASSTKSSRSRRARRASILVSSSRSPSSR